MYKALIILTVLLTPTSVAFAQSFIDLSGFVSEKTKTLSYDLKVDKAVPETDYGIYLTSNVNSNDEVIEQSHRVELNVKYSEILTFYIVREINMLTSFNAVGVEYLRASWFSQKLDVSNKSYSTITKVMFESGMVYVETSIKFSPENNVSLYNKLRYSLGKSMTFSVSSNTDNELNNTLDFKLGYMF